MTNAQTTENRYDDYTVILAAPHNTVADDEYREHDESYPESLVRRAHEATKEILEEQFPGIEVETTMDPNADFSGRVRCTGDGEDTEWIDSEAARIWSEQADRLSSEYPA